MVFTALLTADAMGRGVIDGAMPLGVLPPVPRGWRGGLRPAPWVMGGYAPAGDIVSTPSDLCRFATALVGIASACLLAAAVIALIGFRRAP